MRSIQYIIPLAVLGLLTQSCSLFSNSGNQTNTAANVAIQANGNTTQTVDTTQPQSQNTTSAASTSSAENKNLPTLEQIDQAQKDLAESLNQIDKGAWSQAFALAVASYVGDSTQEARYAAMYAASQMTPIELRRLESRATTHLEQAVLGELLLVSCASQKDNACLSEMLPKTVQSLQTMGETAHAQQLSTVYGGQSSQIPTVAVFLPLSGSDRKIGRAMLGAMIQASGVYQHRSMPFALRFFDTKSSVQTIPQIVQEAKSLGAHLILGPIDIRESAAVAKAIDSDTSLVAFSPNDEFTRFSQRAFQFSYALTSETQTLAQLLVTINAGRVAVVGPESEYTTSASQSLASNLSQSQITTLTYPAAQTDLRDMAKKVAKSNPDAVVMPMSAELSERLASFLAQENLWCKLPGTPQPNAKVDARKFITCLSTSAWSPISANHGFKFIADALYLDYADAADNAGFGDEFEKLYHRAPSVHEAIPYMAISVLKKIPEKAWLNSTELQNRLSEAMPSGKYLLLPGIRQVTTQGSTAFVPQTQSDNTPARTIVAPK